MKTAFLVITVIFTVTFVRGGSVEDLNNLQLEFNDWQLKRTPGFATYFEDYRFNDRLANFSKFDFFPAKVTTERFLKRLLEIPPNSLPEKENIEYLILREVLETFIDGHKWSAYGALNPLTFRFLPFRFGLFNRLPFNNRGDYENYLVRLQNTPQQIDDIIDSLEEAIKRKRTLNIVSIERVPKRLEQLIVRDPVQSDFYRFYFKGTLDEVDSIPADIKEELRDRAKIGVNKLNKSLQKLKVFIEKRYMKYLRQKPGVCGWKNGKRYYQAIIDWHYNGQNLTAEKIHAIGLKEIDRINKEVDKVFRRINFKGTYREFIDSVQGDNRFFNKTGEEILELFREITFDRILPRMPELFNEITEFPLTLVGRNLTSGSVASYSRASMDGSRPGRFSINVFTNLWSREKAVDFMFLNSAQSRTDMENEVTRFTTEPGQVLSYKLGQLKITELRTKAKSELGTRFDIKDFHTTVLKFGAIPLTALEKVVNNWIQTEKSKQSRDSQIQCQSSEFSATRGSKSSKSFRTLEARMATKEEETSFQLDFASTDP